MRLRGLLRDCEIFTDLHLIARIQFTVYTGLIANYGRANVGKMQIWCRNAAATSSRSWAGLYWACKVETIHIKIKWLQQ